MISRTILIFAAALTAAPNSAYIDEVNEWCAKHEADYRRDWVPLSGLFFLQPGQNTAGSVSSSDILLPSSAPGSIRRFVFSDNRSASSHALESW